MFLLNKTVLLTKHPLHINYFVVLLTFNMLLRPRLCLLVLIFRLASSLKLFMSSFARVGGSSNGVCIVGGGFGGLYTAIKTSEKYPELDITVIDNKVGSPCLSVYT